MRPLDRIDFELVGLLQKNARLSNKELAAAVGVAQSTCLLRVRRLIDDGVLRGFHAEIDPAALGVSLQAMIAVRLRRHSHELVESFRAYASSVPEVLAIFHMAGSDDFLLHVAAHDAASLREFTMSTFTTRDEVAHLETRLIFEHLRTPGLPRFLEADE